jgi:3-hydroxyacyl-CoA dehydrogenase
VVDALIAGYRSELGLKPRAIDGEEIVGRCVLALVNEGARLLDEGIELSDSDIDVVFLAGYGFPRYRGGPMFYADLAGLPDVVARMRAFAGLPRADAAFWQPAPLLARLAAEGGKLSP